MPRTIAADTGQPRGCTIRSIPAPAGTSNVCAYAINVAAGNNILLGCRSVTVVGEQGRAPFGFLEAVQGVAGGVEVSGWAIDPDTTASIAVHLYVDGWSGGFVACKLDVDRRFTWPNWPLHPPMPPNRSERFTATSAKVPAGIGFGVRPGTLDTSTPLVLAA